MAIGDDALAAGIPIMNGTEQANTLDTEMNKTRDEIARRQRRAVTPIPEGGTGSTTAAAARTALGLTAMDAGITPSTLALRDSNSALAADYLYLGQAPALPQHATPKSYVDAATAGRASQAALDSVYLGNLSADIYNRTLGGSYRVAYVNNSGVFGWVPSSIRFKKNVKTAVVDIDAILAMRLVTFLYKVEVDTERTAEVQHGLIAEEVDALGLDWLVDYGTEAQAEGIRYDRIGLALLPVVQQLARDLASEREARRAVEERVAAIELHLDAIGGDLDAPTA